MQCRHLLLELLWKDMEHVRGLDFCRKSLFLSKNRELHIECKEVQFRHFLIVFIGEEDDISLVGLKPARSQRD